jgi:nicotinate-nucleotide pyrophosphorylase
MKPTRGLQNQGTGRALLTAERSALNFLQLLSALPPRPASMRYIIAGTKAAILDTRKTCLACVWRKNMRYVLAVEKPASGFV